jgi:hypothetical protein
LALQDGGGKQPGKTAYFGRRRPVTRSSGFKTHEETSGGEFERVKVTTYSVRHGRTLKVTFELPRHKPLELLGFGGWFRTDQPIIVGFKDGPPKLTLTAFGPPDWNKFGSIWQADGTPLKQIEVTLAPVRTCRVALHGLSCGTIAHRHLEDARPELLTNMYQFAPEAIFVGRAGKVRVELDGKTPPVADSMIELIQKSCNRCGRYLPINTRDERNHLSFSNHCVAANRCPCKHATFSKLTNRIDASDRLTLKHGYQLECRFCKKFEVNAAHNPQRTMAQMKEDAARRRAFELLIEELEGGSAQLRYRHQTGGRELALDVYKKFGGRCFSCGIALEERGWHLDHTRPLALLWPLDVTATALCGPCNSDKHDRPPAEFYSENKLEDLAAITGISLADLKDPRPNIAVIRKLAVRLDWFFETFLCSEDMVREHDGKIPGDLLIKALYKALSRSRDNLALELTRAIKQREE